MLDPIADALRPTSVPAATIEHAAMLAGIGGNSGRVGAGSSTAPLTHAQRLDLERRFTIVQDLRAAMRGDAGNASGDLAASGDGEALSSLTDVEKAATLFDISVAEVRAEAGTADAATGPRRGVVREHRAFERRHRDTHTGYPVR